MKTMNLYTCPVVRRHHGTGLAHFIAGQGGEPLFEVENASILGIRSLYYDAATATLGVSHLASGRVHLIDLTNGTLRWYDHHKVSVRDVHIVAPRNLIVAASWDGSVSLTDFSSLRLLHRLSAPGMGRVPQTAISPGNTLIASQSYDSDKNPSLRNNRVRLWSPDNGRLIRTLDLAGPHRSMLRCGSCLFLENTLYCCSSSGFLQAFDVSSGEPLLSRNLNDECHCIFYLRCGNGIIASGRSGLIHFFSLKTGRVRRFDLLRGNDVMFMTGSGSEKNEMVAATCADGSLHLMKGASLRLLYSERLISDILWTAGFINHHLLAAGGEDDRIFLFKLPEDGIPRLAGTITLFAEDYVFLSAGKERFYATHPDIVQVFLKPDMRQAEGAEKAYILHSSNSFGAMRELFFPPGKNLQFRSEFLRPGLPPGQM